MIKKTLLFIIYLLIVVINTAEGEEADLPKVMLTGYWNPTGQMIAEFCTDSFLNPDGWEGANWEGMGVDVYSFFPEPGTYVGWLEVDYQDTWEDFWHLTDSLHPIAILSFGAARPATWEIEYNARNLYNWLPDYEAPTQPTLRPPDSTVSINFKRQATIPVQDVADAVNNETDVNAYIDWNGNPEAFLCEYIAYLGMWYQSQHDSANDPHHCQMAGFIHAGDSAITYAQAKEAAIVSIREVIKALTIQGVDETIEKMPSKVSLKTYPNPYRIATMISFFLPAGQDVKVHIYDVKGKVIARVFNGFLVQGKHLLEFKNKGIVSGMYICRMETAKSGVISSKVTVIK
ncbi:T9SS type A sorting domain-containing protein [Fibrobacterota bacterium]